MFDYFQSTKTSSPHHQIIPTSSSDSPSECGALLPQILMLPTLKDGSTKCLMYLYFSSLLFYFRLSFQNILSSCDNKMAMSAFQLTTTFDIL